MIVTDALPLLETISPADLSAVVDAIAEAAASRTPVYPIGGGTRLRYGVRPKQPGLGLSLSRMTALVDYPARDLTVTVEAGMTVVELARRLAAQRQWLPLDVSQPDRSTLGGLVAANTFGPRRYRWGTIRDYLLGFTAVDGRGHAFSGGGRVVKNAAGYNMARLMVGSLGSLAVITQVTLMVRPIPETSALVVADLDGFDRAEQLLGSLTRTKTLPSAIQWLAGPAWRQLPGMEAEPPSGLGRLLVGVEGTQAEVDWMVGQLQQEWHDAGCSAPLVVCGPSTRDLWRALAEGPSEPSRASEPGRVGPDVLRSGEQAPVGTDVGRIANPSYDEAGPMDGLAIRPSEKPTPFCSPLPTNRPSVLLQVHAPPARMVAVVRSLLDADPQASIQAYAGDGIIRGRLAPKRSEPPAVFCRRLRASLAARDGSLVVMESPAEAELSQETVWGPPGDGQRVMETLKQQFDPQGILNPGRFIFASPALPPGDGRVEGELP
jgi:FAD/FMN-containing dehydrogenase